MDLYVRYGNLSYFSKDIKSINSEIAELLSELEKIESEYEGIWSGPDATNSRIGITHYVNELKTVSAAYDSFANSIDSSMNSYLDTDQQYYKRMEEVAINDE